MKQRGDHYTAGTHPHLHEADPGSLAKAKISVVVKKAARDHVFTSAGILIQEALVENSQMRFLPKPSNLERVAHRQKIRPNHPTGLEFEIQYDHVPEDFLKRDIIVNEKKTSVMYHRPPNWPAEEGQTVVHRCNLQGGKGPLYPVSNSVSMPSSREGMT